MDRAEAGLRAQTGEKPGGGYYTSSERISLQKFSLGRITTLPRTVFGSRVVAGGGGAGVGGPGGGGGNGGAGAIIVRPQTSIVDRAQNLQIQQTQQSVGFVQQGLDFIRNNVQGLVNGITNLGRLLQLEGQVEQKNLKDQQESERRLNERQIRQGRENLLERRITAALARPIASIQRKVVGLFDRIMGAMTTLFFGWLTNQGIETLKAFTSGDSKKLEEIKNHVIKNVLYTIGAFAAIKLGFGLVMRTITALTFRIAGLAAKIALAPFRAAGGAISKLFGLAKPTTKAGARVAITTSGGKVLSREAGIFGKMLSNIKGATRFLGKAGSAAARALPVVGTALDVFGAGSELMRGNLTGAGLYGAAAVTSLIPGLQGVSLATSLAAIGQSAFYKPESKKSPAASQPQQKATPSTKTPPAAPPTPSAAQPQTPAAPQLSDFSFSADTANQITAFEDTGTPATAESVSPYGMVDFEGLQQKLSAPTKTTTPAKVKAPPKAVTPVGTLPEPKPNIIIAGGGQDRTQVVPAQQQEPLTDVPFIPSGNTDNFYVLYSQLNYNVVM